MAIAAAKRPGLDPGRLAVAPEPLGQPLRVDWRAELVGEDQVLVGVSLAGDVPLEQLGLAVARSASTVSTSSSIVRRDLADFGGPSSGSSETSRRPSASGRDRHHRDRE